jgi:tetratricopeptide (TPR) repeat protein
MFIRNSSLSCLLLTSLAFSTPSHSGLEEGIEQRIEKARGSVDRGDFKQAEKEFQAVLEIVLNQLGNDYSALGDFPAAQSAYQEACHRNTLLVDPCLGLATTYLRMGDLETGQKLISSLFDNNPEHPEIKHLMGQAYLLQGDYPEAVAEFKKVIELDPQSPQVHFDLGLTYILCEGAAAHRKAEVEFRRELQNHPDMYLPNFYLGVLLTILRQDEALFFLKKAVELNPVNPDPYLYLGQIYSRRQRYHEAVEVLEQSVELIQEPNRNLFQLGKIHYLLGQALVHLDQREEAKQHLERSQEFKRLKHLQAQNSLTGRSSSFTPVSDFGMTENQFRKLHLSKTSAVFIEPTPDLPTQKRLEERTIYYRKLVGKIFRNLAGLKSRRNQPEKASDYLERAVFWDQGQGGN